MATSYKGLGDVTGDADSGGEFDRARLPADHDPREEALAVLVEQIKRGPVGLQELRDLLKDKGEELVEIEDAPESDTDLLKRPGRLVRARQALFEFLVPGFKLPDPASPRSHWRTLPRSLSGEGAESRSRLPSGAPLPCVMLRGAPALQDRSCTRSQ